MVYNLRLHHPTSLVASFPASKSRTRPLQNSRRRLFDYSVRKQCIAARQASFQGASNELGMAFHLSESEFQKVKLKIISNKINGNSN